MDSAPQTTANLAACHRSQWLARKGGGMRIIFALRVVGFLVALGLSWLAPRGLVAGSPVADRPARPAAGRRTLTKASARRGGSGSTASRQAAEGRLAAGARFPSSRALAAELGLARSTVVLVFEAA